MRKQDLIESKREPLKLKWMFPKDIVSTQKSMDKFAIEFHQWMRMNDTIENAEKYFHYTDKDMLNAFKEEN